MYMYCTCNHHWVWAAHIYTIAALWGAIATINHMPPSVPYTNNEVGLRKCSEISSNKSLASIVYILKCSE